MLNFVLFILHFFFVQKATGVALKVLPNIFEVLKFDIEDVYNVLNGANSCRAYLMVINENINLLLVIYLLIKICYSLRI